MCVQESGLWLLREFIHPGYTETSINKIVVTGLLILGRSAWLSMDCAGSMVRGCLFKHWYQAVLMEFIHSRQPLDCFSFIDFSALAVSLSDRSEIESQLEISDPFLTHSSLFVPMMEAVQTSETSVNLYHSTWHYNPEDSCLHTHHCENLKL
jgi:hypothetical protein